MKNWLSGLRGMAAALACGLTLTSCQQPAEAPATRTDFTIGWTIYVGWMPWAYAEQAGIVDKWADRYGLTINVVQINDYVESLNQYTAGQIDGVTSTTMDALTIPAAGGHDSSIIIAGDYSNGNDGLILKNGATLADINGRPVNLVEFSVSHYLLARALESANLPPTAVNTVNTSDADIVAAYGAPEVQAVVTWNPQLSEVRSMQGANLVFDSSQIPGEILDTLVVSTEALQSNPDLGRALVGIWYETMAIMSSDTPEGLAARTAMAELSGTDLAGYEAQLATTEMYYTPSAALAYMTGAELPQAIERVRQFSFANGLFGEGAASVDAIGIAFADGAVVGDAENVKLRFDASYTAMVAAGELE
jgi:NitT/TauT family transport system substrate-binding protein